MKILSTMRLKDLSKLWKNSFAIKYTDEYQLNPMNAAQELLIQHAMYVHTYPHILKNKL